MAAARASQIDAANGVIRSGARVQRQNHDDGRWYCGIIHDVYSDGTAGVEMDSGEYCKCEGEDVHVLPPGHPGFADVRDPTGQVPLSMIERSFAFSTGLEQPNVFAAGVASPTEGRARKQRSASSHSPMAAASGTQMQTDAPMAGGFAAAAAGSPGGFSFGAPPDTGGGGFTFTGSPPPAPGGGFTFGAAPAAGGGGFAFGS